MFPHYTLLRPEYPYHARLHRFEFVMSGERTAYAGITGDVWVLGHCGNRVGTHGGFEGMWRDVRRRDVMCGDPREM